MFSSECKAVVEPFGVQTWFKALLKDYELKLCKCFWH